MPAPMLTELPENYRGSYEVVGCSTSSFPYLVIFRPYRGIPYAIAAFALESQAKAFADFCNQEIRRKEESIS